MPPFVEDMDDAMDDVPFPNIGTDLFDDNFGNFDDDEEPLDSGPVIPDILKEEVAQTVVRIENEDEQDGDADSNDGDADSNDGDADSNDGDADADLENGHATESAAPEAPMDVPAPVSAKKAGRASKGPSRVSTPASPKSAKAAGGRKRKAEEDVDEPADKRSGRGRATAAAAREGIKEASKKRPRAASGTVKEVPKSGRGKPGRKPKVEKEEPDAEEYEVEEILDSGMDAKTKQVLFLVKWKGYAEGDNTWEPKTNLAHAKELLKDYEVTKNKENKTAKKGTAATKKPAPAKKAPAKAAAKAPVKKAAGKAAAGRPGRPGRRGRPGRPKAK
ncbi:hypothetical protein INS49_002277 [Diaporthe citri]|uniref:uncharacterized protein n=1 Tax=Diaporthe citri TaxID=83186 RepID=UPI001C7F529A|nr:uncharacterized protein INS49_002277 [Diaporthe citri]KAG6368077.1 hypothetical protein INS49_002277 [Diaporthe citri]